MVWWLVFEVVVVVLCVCICDMWEPTPRHTTAAPPPPTHPLRAWKDVARVGQRLAAPHAAGARQAVERHHHGHLLLLCL